MRQKRGIIHPVILVLAIAIVAMMFAVPLIHASALSSNTDTAYMAQCGALARALSREKNVGLALTLMAMVVGFGGVVIVALMTPFVRSLRKVRDAMGILSGMLSLLPLILLTAKSPGMLAVNQVSDAAGVNNLLSGGAYALVVLLILFILLCSSGLLVGMHVKAAARAPKKAAVAAAEEVSEEGFQVWGKDVHKSGSKPNDAYPPERPKPEKLVEDSPRPPDGIGDSQPGSSQIPDPADGHDNAPQVANAPDGIAYDDALSEEPDVTIIRAMASGPVCGVIEGLSGVHAGARIELGADDEIFFGRSPKYANVVINKNNSDISRKHCGVRIEPSSDKYVVTDYSRNGTFALAEGMEGEMRLPSKKATRLPKGTIIQLGRRDHTFLLK